MHAKRVYNFRTKRMINNRDFFSQIYKSRPGLISIFSHIPRSKISKDIIPYLYMLLTLKKWKPGMHWERKSTSSWLKLARVKWLLKTKSLSWIIQIHGPNTKEVILKHEQIQWGPPTMSYREDSYPKLKYNRCFSMSYYVKN